MEVEPAMMLGVCFWVFCQTGSDLCQLSGLLEGRRSYMGLLKVSCAQGLPSPHPVSCVPLQPHAELQERLVPLGRPACSPGLVHLSTALCCPCSLNFHLNSAGSSPWGFPGCGQLSSNSLKNFQRQEWGRFLCRLWERGWGVCNIMGLR